MGRHARQRRTAAPAEELFRIIETSPYGNKRELDNMHVTPWTRTFTREQAEATVAWRTEHIRRYRYEIVPAVAHG